MYDTLKCCQHRPSRFQNRALELASYFLTASQMAKQTRDAHPKGCKMVLQYALSTRAMDLQHYRPFCKM